MERDEGLPNSVKMDNMHEVQFVACVVLGIFRNSTSTSRCIVQHAAVLSIDLVLSHTDDDNLDLWIPVKACACMTHVDRGIKSQGKGFCTLVDMIHDACKCRYSYYMHDFRLQSSNARHASPQGVLRRNTSLILV